MGFQLAYYKLQDFASHMELSDTTIRLQDFLLHLEFIIHQEAKIFQIASMSSNTEAQALLKSRLTEKLRVEANTEWMRLLVEFPTYPYVFLSLDNLFSRPAYAGPEYEEIKKLTKLLHGALNLKSPSGEAFSKEALVKVLFNFVSGKLKKSKEEGTFEFDKDPRVLKEKIFHRHILDTDTDLQALAANELYGFSRENLYQLDLTHYKIIKNNPISHLFLLAGLGVTELDPPSMERTISTTKDLPISSLIQLAESTKKNLGADKFQLLLRTCYQNPTFDLQKLPALLNAANTIGGKAHETFALMIRLLETASSWEAIAENIRDLYPRAIQESHAPIPNDKVYASYKDACDDVLPEFMPSDAELSASVELFERVDALGKTLLGKIESELLRDLHIALSAYQTATTPQVQKEPEAMIWAVLRELFRQTYGILLYNSQMINAFLILNASNQKTVAQIKTGEGKSALQVIMMAFRALTTNKKQFNVTTAAYLAERDVAKFSQYYNKLGLSCTRNVSSDPRKTDLYGKPKSYSGNIVYGTAEAFEFGYMTALLPGQQALQTVFQPKKTDVYIDEMDALVIDKEKSLAQIGQGKNPIDLYDTTRIYHVIWDYIWTHRASDDGKPATYSLNGLRTALIDKGYFTKDTIDKRQNLYKTANWFDSALLALQLEIGRDYLIKPDPKMNNTPSVVIVDRRGTGTLMYGSEWHNGLHQIISARELVPVPKEGGIQAAITQRSFFNLFHGVFAVTGTTGGQPCEEYLTKMYPGISIRNLPRYRASKAIAAPDYIGSDKKAQYEKLLADIVEARSIGYPVLFLFETIRETKEFCAYAHEHGYTIDLLTGDEDTPVDNILAVAGLPGNVLAATFLAGRGADITPSPEAEEKGGLAVRVCSPPKNGRVIWQNFGRTGRQGRHGTYAFCFNRDELLLAIKERQDAIVWNRWYLKPDNETEDLPQNEWEKPYEPIDTLDTPTDTDSDADADAGAEAQARVELTVETLKKENQAQKSARISTLGERLQKASNDTLLKIWHQYREESEHLENLAGINYARYTDLVYELQRFVYDSKDKRLIAALAQNYRLIESDLAQAHRQRMYKAFEKKLGMTLLEMAKDASINIDELQHLTTLTKNPKMWQCIQKAQPKDVRLEDEDTIFQKLYESAEKNLGSDKFKELVRVGYENTIAYRRYLPAVLNAANTIGGRAPIAFDAFIQMLQAKTPWNVIAKNLPDIYALAVQEAFDPIPNEAVYASYQAPSSDVLPEFMPTDKEMRDSIQQFEAMDALRPTLFGNSEWQLKTELDKFVAAWKASADPSEKKKYEPMIWAILRELFRQTYGILLYNTQMINAHLILNAPNHKSIAQIKTGEGKSAQQTIMMAFQALTTEKKQFNVTTAPHLAERDVAKFATYYQKIGLECTTNVSTNPTKTGLHGQSASYEGQIVYGTADAFQFGYMLSMDPRHKSLREVIQPEKTDVYIDEVDALVIDKEQSMSRIQESLAEMTPFEESDIYHHIWEYIWEHRNASLHSVDGLREALIQKGHFTEDTINVRKNLFQTYHWYHSALSALQKELNHDYVKIIDPSKPEEGRIVIVDREGTGSLMHGMVWEHGLHQIIAAREGLPVLKEKRMQTAITQHNFFNLFANLYAVTGTTGGKACEDYLLAMYPGSTIRNMPRYRPSQAVASEPVVSADKTAQYDMLITDILEARKNGQPLLFLFETIRETQEFQTYAEARGYKVSLLTGDDETPIDNILALAGQPGSVLAATFLAGRGADITPSPEAEANGGLGVRVCSPPSNGRVMWQNFGRTGRQGRHGSFAFRFSRDELLLEIGKLERSIQMNRFLLQADNEADDLPARPWETPYEPRTHEVTSDMVVAPASAVESDALTEDLTGDALKDDLTDDRAEDMSLSADSLVQTLKRVNQTKREARVTMLEERYSTQSTDALLSIWEGLREESETLENRASARYAQYTNIVYALQKLVYDASQKYFPEDRRFISALTDNYQIVMSDLDIAFHERKPNAFEKAIGNILLEMGKSCNLEPHLLRMIAIKTENPIILRCLDRARPVDSVPAEPLAASRSFFPTTGSDVLAGMPSSNESKEHRV